MNNFISAFEADYPATCDAFVAQMFPEADADAARSRVQSASRGAAQPNPTRIETNRKYADFDAVLVAGVGHYLHMSRPEEFNPLLLDAIADLTNDTL